MLRQRKGLVLTLAVTIVGGCARSDYRTAQNGQGWGSTPRHGSRWWNTKPVVPNADLPEAKEPAILAETHFGDCKAPCNLTCPGQINVQGYIAHVAKGQYEEALRLVMERLLHAFV